HRFKRTPHRMRVEKNKHVGATRPPAAQGLHRYSVGFRKSSPNSADTALPTLLSADPAILLRTPCGARARENFRRIKKTLVPQSCIRQRARFPLLQSCKRGCNHATVRRVKNHT